MTSCLLLCTPSLSGSGEWASDWLSGGCGFNPCWVGNILSWRFDHDIFSTVFLSLFLIQEGQLSVYGERMCAVLVNRLEDWVYPVKVWFGKPTMLKMTPISWLGRKTSTQTSTPSPLWKGVYSKRKAFALTVSHFLCNYNGLEGNSISYSLIDRCMTWSLTF